jgi:hypothetical protein
VAWKDCPGVAVFELRDSSKTTSMAVLTGTIVARGAKGSLSRFVDLDLLELPASPLGLESVAESELFAAWSADLEHPVSARARVKAQSDILDKRRDKIHLRNSSDELRLAYKPLLG